MDEFDAQELINSGLAWRLEGSIGRQCMAALESGACMLGRDGHRDYWGNYVPSRDEVQAGTKGSFDYVAERYGVKHAETQAAKD
ncbi:hypothetical protein RWE87_13455 [Sinorhizobium meliloti]|uniref:hypothetical protein n=1 Tax=Rhizobium meliloti TaxID=382 RepID=UPI00299E354A|nr:hypothetical protein [Sinorhizobium meliloti]